jgi:hypothetical protein
VASVSGHRSGPASSATRTHLRQPAINMRDGSGFRSSPCQNTYPPWNDEKSSPDRPRESQRRTRFPENYKH